MGLVDDVDAPVPHTIRQFLSRFSGGIPLLQGGISIIVLDSRLFAIRPRLAVHTDGDVERSLWREHRMLESRPQGRSRWPCSRKRVCEFIQAMTLKVTTGAPGAAFWLTMPIQSIRMSVSRSSLISTISSDHSSICASRARPYWQAKPVTRPNPSTAPAPRCR